MILKGASKKTHAISQAAILFLITVLLFGVKRRKRMQQQYTLQNQLVTEQ